MNCSVAQSLEALGDWWTLLIVREALSGTRRFSDFERHLGVAKNVLADRLEHLVDHGVLTREEVGERGKRFEYRLTAKGKDLLTVVTALREWSDRWVYGEDREPLVVRDRRTGRRVPPLRIRDEQGRPIAGRELVVEPGPGADARTRRRFAAARPIEEGSEEIRD